MRAFSAIAVAALLLGSPAVAQVSPPPAPSSVTLLGPLPAFAAPPAVTISGTAPVSLATVPLPTGAATAYAQGSTTSGQVGTLLMGAVSSTPPVVTAAQTDALSLTSFNGLRVSCETLAGADCDWSTTGTVALAYPAATTIAGGSSGNVANASAVATMAAVSGKTNYVCDIQVTGAGSTAGAAVSVTLTGLAEGTKTFTFTAPVGVLVAAYPINLSFPACKAASAVNTAITLTVPATGSGNTNTTANIGGYNQ